MDVAPRKADDRWLQERYASWLDACTRIAFVVTLLAFGAYVAGLVPAHVPLDRLPALWHLPLARYLEATGTPTGWGWLRQLGSGESLSYLGVSLFALIVLACDAAIIVPLLRRGERLLAGLAAAQIVVLLAAASGFFSGG